jgi:hypothetical protein
MASTYTARDTVIHTLFFINSFLPLWIVLLVQVIFFEPELNLIQFYISIIILLCFIVIPAISVYQFIRINENSTGSIKVKITKNYDMTGEYAIYLITFIIAFVSVNFFTEKQIVMFGIIILIFGVVYVRNHMFHINPFITILGFRFHKSSTEVDNDVNILSRRTSLYDKEIRINKIAEGFYIESKMNLK